MAKLGEGDQRWIVKERDDGRNVNSWHWEERDQSEWAKKRLRELLADLAPLDDAAGACKVVSVDSIAGEVSLQSRKQRRFAIYELDITLKWEGQWFDADGKADVETKGTLRIEDLSEETLDSLPCEVTCESTAGRRGELKEIMRTKGAALAKAACLEFVKELKSLVAVGQASDLASLTTDATIAPSAASASHKAAPAAAARANASYVTSAAPGKTETCSLHVEYTFQLHPMFVYESLLDANRMRAVTAADASIEPKAGGRFALFNGSIEGTNVALEPGKRIAQKWRFNTWPAGHFSDVTITFEQDGGNTKLRLEQAGVPLEEKERTEKGWRAMIFERLKMVLGGCPP